MASYSGGTVVDHPSPIARAVTFQPLMPGGGSEPVDPKRFLNVGGAAVPIQ